MKLSEDMAVRLHRMMWSDMQRELGDTPAGCDRNEFKEKWIKTHFPGEYVYHYCFLCEYSYSEKNGIGCAACSKCPIKWPDDTCLGHRENSSYTTTPISKILALPARNGEKCTNDRDLMTSAYCNAKMELAKASGLPEAAATIDHIAEIKKKEDRAVMQVLENFSGLKGEGCWVVDHVKAIQKKAVDEYFEKTPCAKLVSMDVDDAFRQYAKEQMEPLKQQNDRLTKRHIEAKNRLAQESGLDHDRPIDDHIREIVKNSMEAGATEERDRIQEKIYEVLLS